MLVVVFGECMQDVSAGWAGFQKRVACFFKFTCFEAVLGKGSGCVAMGMGGPVTTGHLI